MHVIMQMEKIFRKSYNLYRFLKTYAKAEKLSSEL